MWIIKCIPLTSFNRAKHSYIINELSLVKLLPTFELELVQLPHTILCAPPFTGAENSRLSTKQILCESPPHLATCRARIRRAVSVLE
jgi:hypothetical protein